MKTRVLELYQRVLNRFGFNSQLRKTLEEMSELSVEIHHYLDGEGDTMKLMEEIADVSNMINQLEHTTPTVKATVKGFKKAKLERLEKRLDKIEGLK